jgi:hypothetical protein
MAGQGSTTEQLRADIDAGRAGSNVGRPDPAAAPLGTDEEAGGVPPAAAAVSVARHEEAANSRARTQQQGLGMGTEIYAGVIAVVIAALSGIAVWMSS